MSEPIAPEPVRGSAGKNSLLVGGLAFVGGVAATAAALHFWGGPEPTQPIVPATVPTTIEAPAPVRPTLPPGTDIATLNAREQELAARLDQLDARLREVDGGSRLAAAHATRAEQLMVAFAARRTVERGQPLGYLEPQLRARFGEKHGDAVAAILHAGAEPVTLEDLRLALDTIAPRLTTSPSDTMWGQARRLLADLVVVRKAESPSPRTSDRMRRARRALDQGQVEAALAEVVHMPGASNAESWVSAARRYIAARKGLTEIEKASLEAPNAVPAAAAATTPPPALATS